MTSIRLRLLFSVLSFFVLGWIVVAVFAYLETEHEIEGLFDSELSQSAQVLIGIVHFESDYWADVVSLEDDLSGHKYEIKISFQIWKGSKMLLKSYSAPELPLSRTEGYSDQLIDGKKWRVYRQHDSDSGLTVNVAELYEIRDELARHIAWGVMTPLFIALPLLAVLFWYAIARGLVPLARVADEVECRSPEDLSALQSDNVPEEIISLTDALNHLFERVSDTLVRERRFTSDAAHELRTPLASLKIQSQVALRAESQEDRVNALQQIIAGVDRATRLIEQLLTLARLDPIEAKPDFREVDLASLATDVLIDLAAKAQNKHIEIGLDANEPRLISGNAIVLSILIRNLVDNAINYTPEGGAVSISVQDQGDDVLLSVEDSGPGVPASERDHLFERFFRGGAGGSTFGSGLGLSIVRRIVEIHHASIRVSVPASGRGLKVIVRFKALEQEPEKVA